MSIGPGTELGGGYRIVEQVGQGAMGTVYRAYQPSLDRHVAIKVVPPPQIAQPGFRERFQLEAVTIAQLRHPNILVVHDYGEHEGYAYLVTEFIDGHGLDQRVGSPRSLDYTLGILGPIAGALDYAHARGIIHRDVKPANILITGDGTAILSDFGLAKLLHADGPGSAVQTSAGMVLGTPAYMAPEYSVSEAVGSSVDRYALAVVAYELLTGRLPYMADTPLALLLAHVQRPLPPPSAVNPTLAPAVEEVLVRALDKDPYRRYPRAAAFINALADAGRSHDQAYGAGFDGRPAPPCGGSAAPVAPDLAAPGPRPAARVEDPPAAPAGKNWAAQPPAAPAARPGRPPVAASGDAASLTQMMGLAPGPTPAALPEPDIQPSPGGPSLPVRGESAAPAPVVQVDRPVDSVPDPALAAARQPSMPSPPGEEVELPDGQYTFMEVAVGGGARPFGPGDLRGQPALARYQSLLDGAIRTYAGTPLVQHGADDLQRAVFAGPVAALAASVMLARSMLAEPWPADLSLRAGVALYTGAAVERDSSYYGPALLRGARLCRQAHAGQILVCGSTQEALASRVPAGVSLRPLGTLALSPVQPPEPIYQAIHAALPTDFPPLDQASLPSLNLPLPATSFVGFERAEAAVMALLGEAAGGRGMVTLVAPAGAGKTRLALQVAGELADAYADGVCLVELATVAEEGAVPDAVAAAISLPNAAQGRTAPAALIEHLRSRSMLLVLDTCEHLVAACGGLATALMRSCPKVRMLATSREALAVAGETVYRVAPLSLPAMDTLPAPETLARLAAVRLFLDRARARRPDFSLTPQNARVVSEICVRLDGIPLAIELAAARVGAMPIEAIAGRLDDRFRLLTGGPRTALPRQQTLKAALDWSHELLSEAEQVLLRRLAVFAGGWTLDAAEAVCAGDGIDEWEVLDLLEGLVNKSLVVLDERADGARYRLLETVRQYGRERLDAADETAAVRDRHAGWALAFTEQARLGALGPESSLWQARLHAEHENLRAALRWATSEGGRPAAGVGVEALIWSALGESGHGGRRSRKLSVDLDL